MFTLFFSVQGSLFSFPPDLLACLFIYPWSVGELSVAQLWKYTKEEYVIFQSARTGNKPVLALRSMNTFMMDLQENRNMLKGCVYKNVPGCLEHFIQERRQPWKVSINFVCF